jgi:tRNA 2-thiouridine synthesizing protein A
MSSAPIARFARSKVNSIDDSRPQLDMRECVGAPCRDCARRCTATEALGSVALGFKGAPRCLNCLAVRLGRPARELRADLVNFVRRRDCYARAWAEAERLDGADTDWPRLASLEDAPVNYSSPDRPTAGDPKPAAAWDAGDLGCGELVLALRLRLNALPAGSVLKVTATDLAAPEDLPAWCRLTGNRLVGMIHPEYLIRRKEA